MAQPVPRSETERPSQPAQPAPRRGLRLVLSMVVFPILLGLAMGGTPIGAPIVGWVADRFGPRWALGVGAAAGISAAGVGLYYLAKHRNLRMHFDTGRPRFAIDVAEL